MNRIYDWFRLHIFTVDLVGALLLFLLFGVLAAVGATGSGVHLAISAALILPLAWRRTRPVAAGVVIAVVALVQWAFAILPGPYDVAVIAAVYALAGYAPRWASLSGLVVALLGGVMVATRYYNHADGLTLANLPYAGLICILAWLLVLVSWAIGDLTRSRRLRLQALEDRSNRLEVEQQHERALAASDERAHIAREMHDIVAHSLSVIITQADGARYAAQRDPGVAPATLATIAETGRSSLQEMRRLLGVLRGGSDDASTRPLPSLADLDELLLGFRASGLELTFSTVGKARRQLPAGAELTAYRIIQESLTNVLKHAGASARGAVELSWTGRGLAITVTDDGRGLSAMPVAAAAAPDPITGGGNGIRGMTERVKLYDGSLSAEAPPDGGFRVHAIIPYSET